MPLIMLLKFQNRHFTFEQLWVGLPVLAGVLVGVTVLALVSSLITLRRVAITPLGVMNRAVQPLPAAWRALIFLVVMAGLYAMLSNASMFAGFAGLGENAVLVLVLRILTKEDVEVLPRGDKVYKVLKKLKAIN